MGRVESGGNRDGLFAAGGQQWLVTNKVTTNDKLLKINMRESGDLLPYSLRHIVRKDKPLLLADSPHPISLRLLLAHHLPRLLTNIGFQIPIDRTVGFWLLEYNRASALRATVVHLVGGSLVYKTLSSLFVLLSCL